MAQQRARGGEHRFGLGQQTLAGAGERDAPRAPVKQGNAQFFLKRLDLAGDGRLRQVQDLSRTRQVADFGHGDKRAQLVDLHGTAW
jgi:hypothetical protein